MICSTAIFGQHVQVSNPELEMRDNVIHITYDILNSTPSQEFTVELIITDSDGKRIRARTLTGDVGEGVTGGYGKQIAWDLEVDKIEMNADIYVKVHVKAVPPPEPVITESPVKDEEGTDGKYFSRTGLILQSAAIPGLGLTRYKGGSHWIKGALGYGCIAGCVIMNRIAVNTYNGINDLAGYDAKNSEYQKSLRQDQVSEALAYVTIAIWISDLVWTIVGTSDLDFRAQRNGGGRFTPSIDPVSHTPLIAFTFQF
jgi:hypothetical protein